jgi:hypothetical protein
LAFPKSDFGLVFNENPVPACGLLNLSSVFAASLSSRATRAV